MPCLDEARTVGQCVEQARGFLQRHGIAGEVVVADNGSRDGSREVAERAGARVVLVTERGYGAALAEGIAQSRGRFVIMGDSDASYDWSELGAFVERLREGFELVMGNRFRGGIRQGAMPFLHRYLGNPVLSWLGRLLFRVPVSDFHCGLRAFRKQAYQAMRVRTSGMEFASELVVKAAVLGMRIEEAPVTLRPDQRGRPPHLRTWRDGWRHLRFLLTLSPRWTLFVPGALLAALGALLMALVFFGPAQVRAVTLDVHTMVVGSLLVTVGHGAMTTAIALRIYALVEELGPPAPRLERMFSVLTLERGLAGGVLVALCGATLIGGQVWRWYEAGFGPLDVSVTLRPTILGATLVAVGAQTVLFSFVYSMLGIQRRSSPRG
jgi:hypothetical protein